MKTLLAKISEKKSEITALADSIAALQARRPRPTSPESDSTFSVLESLKVDLLANLSYQEAEAQQIAIASEALTVAKQKLAELEAEQRQFEIDTAYDSAAATLGKLITQVNLTGRAFAEALAELDQQTPAIAEAFLAAKRPYPVRRVGLPSKLQDAVPVFERIGETYHARPAYDPSFSPIGKQPIAYVQ
jgi:hypothetical protein